MVAFVTLFLALIVGVQPVQLAVGTGVDHVVLRLDGKRVSTIRQPPWSASVDFGKRLQPHRLEAIAYGSDGGKLGAVSQWINLPRQPAESSLVVDTEGPDAVARLSWRSIRGTDPIAIRFSFDGQEIPVADPSRIQLPSYDPQSLHFLRAELDFPDNLSSVVEVTLGGRWLAQTSSELTAVPIEVESRRRALKLSDLDGHVQVGGRRARLSAIEEGPAQILLVTAGDARRDFNGMVERAQSEARERRARLGFQALERLRRSGDPLLTVLRRGDWIRFVWPRPQSVRDASTAYDVFNYSREFTSDDGSFVTLLTEVRPPGDAAGEQRLSDAVAVAGLLAAARSRRRAVILIANPESTDRSQFDPAQVRGFLESLHVPLFVWTPSAEPQRVAVTWGETEDISDLHAFEQALQHVASTLERQRILWIEGESLPQNVELDANLPNVKLAQ